MRLEIHVPGAPRGKERPRFNTETGRAYTPEKTARYENLAAIAARDAMQGRRLFEGPLILRMEAYIYIPGGWPAKKRAQAQYGLLQPEVKPDFDNIAKIIDALNKIVWVDDAQICRASIEKYYSEQPRLLITVENYWNRT